MSSLNNAHHVVDKAFLTSTLKNLCVRLIGPCSDFFILVKNGILISERVALRGDIMKITYMLVKIC